MDFSQGGKKAIERMVEAYGFTTRQALCEQLGISKSSLATRYMRDSFPSDWVIQCALETGVNIKWLVTGLPPKHEYLTSDIINIQKIKLIDGVLLDAGTLMFDKVFIPDGLSSPSVISNGNNSYFIERDFTDVVDGDWLISIDGKHSIKQVIRIPDNKVKINYGNIFVDMNINDLVFIGKVIAEFKIRG
ncbi:TPA: phage repressor protein CI [Escherichia coli]|nr:phage repressor protein CI [Escherichia coli]EMB3608380.1 phage repressor protein CI [Escherichia coli]HCB4355780.1 phage repressor protein CI [Escherichia coli]